MSVTIVTDTTAVRASEVLDLYREYEWWEDRSEDRVARAIQETDVFVGLRDAGTDRLVASARVLTDYTYYATIYDVIVAADRREEGLGERVVDAVVDHPELQAVDVLRLDCRPALVPFYEAAGFEVRDLDTELETMILRRRDLQE